MKKTFISVITAFAVTALAFARPVTPEEKSLEVIKDKAIEMVFVIETRLRPEYLEDIKLDFKTEAEMSKNWDRYTFIVMTYKQFELEVVRAAYQHHLVFGRGERISKQEKALSWDTSEYLKQAEKFWKEVQAIRDRLEQATENYDNGIEMITTLGPSLARQVIREDQKTEKDEPIED